MCLDPRSFHPLKHKEEACGGVPQRRVNRGRTILDLTGSNMDVPDTSQLYNHFPPVVRPTPRQPVLPDIFGPDCLISKNKTRAAGYQYQQDDDDDDTMSHGSDAPREDDSSGSDRGSETDSENISNGRTRTNDNDIDAPHQPSHGQLTTAEFLQYALFEALGNAPPGHGVYDENYSDYDEDDEPLDDGRYEYSESNDGSEYLSYECPSDRTSLTPQEQQVFFSTTNAS